MRKRREEETTGDAPPVRDELRLIEPLGPRIPWGRIESLDNEMRTPPIDLTRQFILLGRQTGCDIILDDDKASRYHALLKWDHGRAYLQDNNSLNGTLVNGQRAVGPVPLRDGDIIEVLDMRFHFAYTPQSGLVEMAAQPTEKIALPGLAHETPKAPGAMRLIEVHGPEEGRSWPVGMGPLSIGRGSDSTVLLPHASVSRHHAQLVNQAAGLYIQDVGSSNGTSVNGEPLTAPRRLQGGDHIQVGDVMLVLSQEEGARASAVANDEPSTARLPTAPPAAAEPAEWRHQFLAPQPGARLLNTPDAPLWNAPVAGQWMPPNSQPSRPPGDISSPVPFMPDRASDRPTPPPFDQPAWGAPLPQPEPPASMPQPAWGAPLPQPEPPAGASIPSWGVIPPQPASNWQPMPQSGWPSPPRPAPNPPNAPSGGKPLPRFTRPRQNSEDESHQE